MSARLVLVVACLVGVSASATGCLEDQKPRMPNGPPGSIVVENRSSDSLCAVYLISTEDKSTKNFGPNWLVKHDHVEANDKRRIEIPQAAWNLRLKDCLDRTVYQRVGIKIGSETHVVYSDADDAADLVNGEKYARPAASR